MIQWPGVYSATVGVQVKDPVGNKGHAPETLMAYTDLEVYTK